VLSVRLSALSSRLIIIIIVVVVVIALQEGRALGRPTRRWVDNIKIDLREIGWDSMDWIDLAHDRD
jgi:hypothetical protein